MGGKISVVLAICIAMFRYASACERSDVEVRPKSDKYLVLITSFSGWITPSPKVLPALPSEPLSQNNISVNASTNLLEEYKNYIGTEKFENRSETGSEEIQSSYCLAAELGYTPDDTDDAPVTEAIHKSQIGPLQKTNYSKKDVYSSYSFFQQIVNTRGQCPAITDFTTIFDAGSFDFVHIILPVDRKLSSAMTENFFHRYVEPKCDEYRSCAILSLGENRSSSFDKESTKAFRIEDKVYQLGFDPYERRTIQMENPSTGSMLIQGAAKEYVSVCDARSNVTCNEHALQTNKFCSAQHDPIPFLFMHVKSKLVYGLDPSRTCEISKTFDTILTSLFQ